MGAVRELLFAVAPSGPRRARLKEIQMRFSRAIVALRVVTRV
jgi:hypothetical protein